MIYEDWEALSTISEKLLRSRCYNAKSNYKKLYKNDLLCSYGCQAVEEQLHLLTQCKYLNSQNTTTDLDYNHIFLDTDKQKKVIKIFLDTDRVRKQLKENPPPGGGNP